MKVSEMWSRNCLTVDRLDGVTGRRKNGANRARTSASSKKSSSETVGVRIGGDNSTRRRYGVYEEPEAEKKAELSLAKSEGWRKGLSISLRPLMKLILNPHTQTGVGGTQHPESAQDLSCVSPAPLCLRLPLKTVHHPRN